MIIVMTQQEKRIKMEIALEISLVPTVSTHIGTNVVGTGLCGKELKERYSGSRIQRWKTVIVLKQATMINIRDKAQEAQPNLLV